MAKRLVYLDNAATTPVRPEVLEAMLPYLGKAAFGNPSSAHRFGRTARAGVEEAKRSIAAALGAGGEPGQGIFTTGGTDAAKMAALGAIAGALVVATAGAIASTSAATMTASTAAVRE